MSDIISSRGGTTTCMGCQWCQAQVMIEGLQTAKKTQTKHSPDKKWLLSNESQLGITALPT